MKGVNTTNQLAHKRSRCGRSILHSVYCLSLNLKYEESLLTVLGGVFICSCSLIKAVNSRMAHHYK